MTLLLTVVAFQYAIQGDMPAASEITHIDRYIMWAYLCLTLLIVEVAIANLLHVGIYTQYGEMIMMIFLIIMWLGGSIKIIIIPWRKSKNVNWEKISDMLVRSINICINFRMNEIGSDYRYDTYMYMK